MSVAEEFEKANENYSGNFTKGDLALPPSRHVAVLTCMDARLDPARALGLEEGDSHVIRNAGGRATDGLRSLIISQKLLGTNEIVVIHHTDCGMLTFKDDELKQQIKDEFKDKEHKNLTADHIAFLPFSDLKQSVLDDVEFLKDSKYVNTDKISGYIYDVKTGKINPVI